MNESMPSIFIPHGGGPCFFMEWDPADTWVRMEAFLRDLWASLPQTPRAVLVVTAHWEQPMFTVSAATTPGMIFDYYGFPKHTYRLQYPAPGAPDVASRVAALMKEAGLEGRVDPDRGFDHGVFVPLMVIRPEADVPVVSLSVRRDLDAQAHLDLGRALEPLRREGVLILGSGMSYHNLAGFGARYGPVSEAFDGWLEEAVTASTQEERATRLAAWESAPAARSAHPREEHLIPLMVCAGAGGADRGHRIYDDHVLGLKMSAFQFG